MSKPVAQLWQRYHVSSAILTGCRVSLISKYPHCIVWFRHKARVWQTGGITLIPRQHIVARVVKTSVSRYKILGHWTQSVVYDLWNSSVFNLLPKVCCRDCDAVTDDGRLFQVRAAATWNKRSSMELHSVGWTISATAKADCSRLRGSKSV